MAKPATEHLRLYTEQPPEAPRPEIETFGSLPEALKAFRQATGWSLQYVAGSAPRPANDLTWSAPVSPGDGSTLGHLRLDSLAPDRAGSSVAPVGHDAARAMAAALAGMLDELAQTRHALWLREAELAAGVPIVPHPEEEKHLAARLQAVLRGGAEAVGCQAAALYLLDDATTELKLRSSWGLPPDRLTAPARRLKGSLADLEALLGHAVVLEDAELMRHWKVPEDFAAAVCVPVSTPTTLLGTLWVYSVKKRGLDDHQTNILEMAAGRVASDLEREMLLREGVDGARVKKQLTAAERFQRHQLPTIAPLLDGWEVAGWTAQAEALGGAFHDWFCLPDGLLAVTAGNAGNRGLEAAMAANVLKAALRAHGQYHRDAELTLRQTNLALWTGSAGDQHATVFYGLIETATGRICYSLAGQPAIIVLRGDGWESLSRCCPPLGESPESDYEQFGYELQPGEVLLIVNAGARDAVDRHGCPLGEEGLVRPLVGRLDLSADQLLSLARARLEAHAAAPDRDDRTMLVVKRTDP